MIITLTQELIDQHAELYDASHLEAGMRVFFDGEMYFTRDEVREAIWKLESELPKMGEPMKSDMQAELAWLKAAHAEFDAPVWYLLQPEGTPQGRIEKTEIFVR